MKSGLRRVALVALGCGALSSRLPAQVLGLPVRNAGIGTGIGIAGDLGFPNGDAGKGLAAGVSGTVGLGPLGVSATLARYDPKGAGDAITSVGGTGNLKIFGGPLIPLAVTLQAGGARWSGSTTEGGDLTTLHGTLGLGIGLTIPNPVFSIKPWLAPRLDLLRTKESGGSVSGSVTHTDTNLGLSGGVEFGFLIGLTARVMYDRVWAGNGVHPGVLSLGLGVRVGT